jgi:hypothetical protein
MKNDVRLYCYEKKQLSIAGRTLMSDDDFMTKERIYKECSCDMKSNCAKVCYLLMGNREDVAFAVEIINQIQKR